MARGRIDPPNLDDRTWQDLVNQAKALIPKYAPEWTDHNPSDLGITLIELFAWLVEQMIYRLNRVPEKNYIAFLNLLGITRDPAIPASTYLTFRVSGDKAVIVPKGSQAATQPRTGEDAIIFETDAEITVLPANLVTVISRREPGSIRATDKGLFDVVIETPAELFLGFDRAAADAIRLHFGFSQPFGGEPLSEPQIVWSYSAGDKAGSWQLLDLKTIDDRTDAFTRDGFITIPVPANWTSHAPVSEINQKLYWIRLAFEKGSQGSAPKLGIKHLLFNSVEATNALTVTSETLGTSNGKSFQSFNLRHYPIFKQSGEHDSYHHLIICVGQSIEAWKRVDDIPEEAKNYYRLDPVTGAIYFGDGKNGALPSEGSLITAKSYRYVAGGVRGNVMADTITALYSADLKQNGVIAVTNLVAANGGFDEELIEETKQRAPDMLRNRNRAVTLEDYGYLAREASIEVNKVQALGPILGENGEPQSFGGLNRDQGHVNVMIIPQLSKADPLEEPRPIPSETLLQEVHDHLDQRRMLTAKVTVTGPRYLPVDATLRLKVWKKAVDNKQVPDPGDQTEFQKWGERVIGPQIQLYLHPTCGGSDNGGWDFGEDVVLPDLAARIQQYVQQELQIGFVADIKIKAGTPAYSPGNRPYQSEPGAWVQIADYEIVCSGTHSFSGEIQNI